LRRVPVQFFASRKLKRSNLICPLFENLLHEDLTVLTMCHRWGPLAVCS
jgi:hypothetical protein